MGPSRPPIFISGYLYFVSHDNAKIMPNHAVMVLPHHDSDTKVIAVSSVDTS